MADNFDQKDAASVTKTIAADEIASVLYQRVKPAWGPDGTATDVDSDYAARLPTNAQAVGELYITGQGVQSTLGNNVLNSTAGTAAVDLMPNGTGGGRYRSFAVQIVGGASISAGAVIFEGSNNNVTFHTLSVYDDAVITGTPIQAAITIAANSSRVFSGKALYRYLRCRISTAFTGGSVFIQAFAILSQGEYVPRVVTVGNPTAGNFANNNAQINGVTPLMGNGTTGTGSQRVTIASDNTANSNPWLQTMVASAAQGASTTHHAIAAATTNATSVKASAGCINSLVLSNASAAANFFKLYNKASAPTVGTDTPIMTVLVPIGGTVTVDCGPYGIRCATGIAYALTGGITVADATALALSDMAVSISYT